MPQKPDEILADELKKLAEKTTRKKTGSGLVRWVAGKMPDNAFQLALQFELNAEEVLRASFSVLDQMGQIRDDIAHESPNPVATAVVGSGFLDLNPTVVAIEIAESDDCCEVLVYGTAKEGLIKQRAGEKAARKAADLLREQLGGTRE